MFKNFLWHALAAALTTALVHFLSGGSLSIKLFYTATIFFMACTNSFLDDFSSVSRKIVTWLVVMSVLTYLFEYAASLLIHKREFSWFPYHSFAPLCIADLLLMSFALLLRKGSTLMRTGSR